jgi:hypothetical protein
MENRIIENLRVNFMISKYSERSNGLKDKRSKG